MILGFCSLRFAMYIIYSVPVSLLNERVIAPRKTQALNIQSIYLHWPLLDRKLRSLQCRYNTVFTTKITAATIGPWPRWFRDFFHKSEPQIFALRIQSAKQSGGPKKNGNSNVAIEEPLAQNLAVQVLKSNYSHSWLGRLVGAYLRPWFAFRSSPWFRYIMFNQNRSFFLRHTPVFRHNQ